MSMATAIEPDAPAEEIAEERPSLWRRLFSDTSRVRRLEAEVVRLRFENATLRSECEFQAEVMLAMQNMVANVGQLHGLLARQNGYQPEQKR